MDDCSHLIPPQCAWSQVIDLWNELRQELVGSPLYPEKTDTRLLDGIRYA